jgi:hypothetical protein
VSVGVPGTGLGVHVGDGVGVHVGTCVGMGVGGITTTPGT